ncbi:MAG: hypothetical protein AB7N91_01710 [Candidatus Tectimicrobiota bacterium]
MPTDVPTVFLRPINRARRLACLLWLGLCGLLGCTMDEHLSLVRADTVALERQSAERHQHFESQVQRLHERVTRFEKSQQDLRRHMGDVTTTLQELRKHMQRLRANLQEMQRQGEPGSAGEQGNLQEKPTGFVSRLERGEHPLRTLP